MSHVIEAAAGSAVEGPAPEIGDADFARVQRFIFAAAGITLGPSKKALVTGRLGRRLAEHGLTAWRPYLELLESGAQPDEVQIAIDLLTTNETYFFREARHLEALRGIAAAAAAAAPAATFRVWSAACSSGEEVYSIAMVLDECRGSAPWQVLGTDISRRVLHDAVRGIYTMERARHLSHDQLARHCLKGTDEHEGRLLVRRELRRNVSFGQLNLNEPLPDLGRFDVIFLRNVMIYFSEDTKRQVVARVLSVLQPGGHLCVGHSESLNGLTDAVAAVAPAMYRKPPRP